MPLYTPGYSTRSGRFANLLGTTLFAAGTVLTATTTSNSIELGDRGTARITLAVTAAAGTNPTLDVQLQTSPDGSTWTNLGSAFTQATGVTSQRKIFTGLDRFIQAVATIGGTGGPSFTFSLDGEAC